MINVSGVEDPIATVIEVLLVKAFCREGLVIAVELNDESVQRQDDIIPIPQ